jgi:nitrate reductase NapE component
MINAKEKTQIFLFLTFFIILLIICISELGIYGLLIWLLLLSISIATVIDE